MPLVLLCAVMFLIGVIVLGAFQFVAERVHRHVELPMNALSAIGHGFGFLVCIPFVLAILVENNGWTSSTVLVGTVIFLAATISFGIGLVFLFLHHRSRRVHA